LADPAGQGDAVFAIGKCYDPSQAPLQRPGSFAYNCDTTGVMEDMTWSSWGPDGARGTGSLQFYSDMTIAYPQDVPPWINPGTTWSPGTIS